MLYYIIVEMGEEEASIPLLNICVEYVYMLGYSWTCN
jgi:hypothetical protein